MTREQLAHCLRAAARIAGDPDILVIGSQAILGSHGEDELPFAASRSIEVDVAFLNESGDPTKADQVDGDIGEGSSFHQSHGYYPQGVDVTTAKLPGGWRDRRHLEACGQPREGQRVRTGADRCPPRRHRHAARTN